MPSQYWPWQDYYSKQSPFVRTKHSNWLSGETYYENNKINVIITCWYYEMFEQNVTNNRSAIKTDIKEIWSKKDHVRVSRPPIKPCVVACILDYNMGSYNTVKIMQAISSREVQMDFLLILTFQVRLKQLDRRQNVGHLIIISICCTLQPTLLHLVHSKQYFTLLISPRSKINTTIFNVNKIQITSWYELGVSVAEFGNIKVSSY